MSDPVPPSPPPVIPPAPPGSIVCPACGWPSPPGSVRCEFCATPFARPAPKPPPPDVVCPHCGGVSPQLPGRRRCPDCGRGYAEPPSAARKLLARVVRLVRSVRISAHALVFILIVGTGLTMFFVQKAMSDRSSTADHIRQIKQRLEIYDGENGGYPATLADGEMAERYGLSPNLLKDGWGRELRYTVSGEFGGSSAYHQEPRYRSCEVRSAGPNGDFDDDDDIVWKGEAR